MKLIDSIYKAPQDWELNDHWFIHNSKKTRVWIGNGLKFYRLNGGGEWSKKFKKEFRKAFIWWCENRPVDGGN